MTSAASDEVPGDALYYAEGGNVGGSLSGLIGSLKESVAATPERPRATAFARTSIRKACGV